MKKNNQIFNFAKKIINYPRSLSGKGVRETLKEIKKIVPNLSIKNFKSGKKVFDWVIPDEWNIKNAYIKEPSGKKILDFKKNLLSIVYYSMPIKKWIKKNFNRYGKSILWRTCRRKNETWLNVA